MRVVVRRRSAGEIDGRRERRLVAAPDDEVPLDGGADRIRIFDLARGVLVEGPPEDVERLGSDRIPVQE